MAEREVQRRLAAILAADVAGYTRLMEDDTDGTVAAWQNAREDIIKPQVDSHSGKIVKFTGDGFLVEFPTVQNAVKCAIALQDDLNSNRLDFRMGVNLGDIVDDGEDIHGEGVNVAARIEALADVGGISISGSVYEQIRNRIDVHYEDCGEHNVKNVSAPVRVFAIRQKSAGKDVTTETADKQPSAIRKTALIASIAVVIAVAGGVFVWQPWVPEIELASVERKAISLPDKPSIAVLPFLNLSDDPNQEYFVDGMTEDLITDLAKIKSLFVIARNTVFTYKGKSVVVPDVARELGIKYVLEGSVRRVGDVVRINAQLIDGKSGAHIWAERYDGKLANIFVMQDKVMSEIVAQLKITLTPDEKTRQNKKDTNKPEAYDAYLRGWQFYRRHTPEDFF